MTGTIRTVARPRLARQALMLTEIEKMPRVTNEHHRINAAEHAQHRDRRAEAIRWVIDTGTADSELARRWAR